MNIFLEYQDKGHDKNENKYEDQKRDKNLIEINQN